MGPETQAGSKAAQLHPALKLQGPTWEARLVGLGRAEGACGISLHMYILLPGRRKEES